MARGESSSDLPRYLGDFRIEREIGRGGMGVVYEARQKSLGRTVALKVLEAHLTLQPETVERFHREAAAAAGLHHPNILPVYSSGEEDGAHYFAMERIEGVPLDVLLDEVRGNEEIWIDAATVRSFTTHPEREPAEPDSAGPSEEDGDGDRILRDLVERFRQHPIERVCRVVLQMASALEYAHEHRLLHRDVKTSNILLRPDGNAVLIDFGLARDLEGPSLTRTGDLVGSPYTLAPEQILEHPDTLDRRVDVYALGVVLYELLTLRRPFEGKTIQDLLQKIQARDPVPPRRRCRNVPRDLETICLKALEKRPGARYPSCREMAEDLRRFLAYLPILARPTGWYRRGRKFFRRQRAASLSAVALVVILAGTLVYFRTQPAHVEIQTDPPGASVKLDGAWQDGVTPMRLPVKAGAHRVEVYREDHEVEVRELELGPGALQEVSLQLASADGWVLVETDPAGATVRFDGPEGPVVPDDRTPLQVRLPAGDYQVELLHEGFDRVCQSLTVPSRGRSERLVYRWPTGLLQVDALQNGAVVELFRGDRCQGTPLRTVTLPLHEPVALAPGTYSIRSRIHGHDERCREGRAAIQVPASGQAEVALWHPPLVRERLTRTGRELVELLAGDRNGDGVLDAVAVARDGSLTCLGPEGRVVQTCDLGFEPRCHTWFDRDGDGFRELLLGGGEGQVVAVDHAARVHDLFRVAGSLTTLVPGDGVLHAATDVGEVVTYTARTGEVRREVVASTVAGMVEWNGELALVTGNALVWQTGGWRRRLEGGGHLFKLRPWHSDGTGPLALSSWGDGSLQRVPVHGSVAEVLTGVPITAWTSWDEPGVLAVGRSDGSVAMLDGSGQHRKLRTSGRSVQHLVPVRLDGRQQDLAILCEDRIEVIHADGSLRFRADHSGAVTAAVALDPDGRGAEVLLLAGENGEIRRLGIDRRQVLGWDTRGHRRVLAGDWLPSPGDEVVVQVDSVCLEVLSGADGRLRQVTSPAPLTDWAVAEGPEPWLVLGSRSGLWGGPLGGDELIQLSLDPVRKLATGDLDGDGVDEILAAFENGRIEALLKDSAPRFGTGLRGKGAVVELRCLEATGTREAEVVIGTDQGVIVILDSMGRPRPTRRVASGITHLLPVRGRATDLVLVDETEVHFLDRRLSVHTSVSAGDPVRELVLLRAGEDRRVVAGTENGELIAWQDGDQVWSVDLSEPILAMATRSLPDGDQDLVVLVEDEVLVVKSDGRRAATWARTVQDEVLALADVDADGVVEVLLGMADGLRADALLEDPRHRQRRRFMEALVAEEEGGDPSVRRDLLQAGLSWLHLEPGDLDEVRARLAASDADSGRRMLEVLEVVRPAGALGWARCVAWQVDRAGPADDLVRTTGQVPAPGSVKEAAAAAAILEGAVRRLERDRRQVPSCVEVKLGELQQVAGADRR